MFKKNTILIFPFFFSVCLKTEEKDSYNYHQNNNNNHNVLPFLYLCIVNSLIYNNYTLYTLKSQVYAKYHNIINI
jgi:hypothetical protein